VGLLGSVFRSSKGHPRAKCRICSKSVVLRISKSANLSANMNQTHNPHTRNPRISTSNPVHCQPYIFFEKVNLTCTDACIAKHKPAQISTGASPTYTHTLLIGTHCSKPKQCVHILPPFYHLSTRMKLAKALFYPKKIATWSLNSNY
jgi:hypothetical protein